MKGISSAQIRNKSLKSEDLSDSIVINDGSTITGSFVVKSADGLLLSASAATDNIIVAGGVSEAALNNAINGLTHSVMLTGSNVIASASVSVSITSPQFEVNSNIFEVAANGMEITGSLDATGHIVAKGGLTGSLTELADGSPYLLAGQNVTLTTQSNGAVVIASNGGGGGNVTSQSFFISDAHGAIYTSGSVAFVGDSGQYGTVVSPQDIGTDVFFYVSGALGSTGGSTPGAALFGGDLIVSGSTSIMSGVLVNGGAIFNADTFEISGSMVIISGETLVDANRLEITGSFSLTNGFVNIDAPIWARGPITSSHGFSGSLTTLTDGTPYLLAGPSIILSTGSSGAITISSVGGGGSGWTTAYEIDFTAQSSQTAGSDGTFTIDGKSWYAQNVSNSTSVGINNGEGFVIQASSTSTDWWNSMRTLSNISIKLTDLDSNLTWTDKKLRVWCNMTGSGLLHTYEMAILALEHFWGSGSPPIYSMAINYGWHTGGGGAPSVRNPIRYTINGGTTEGFSLTHPEHDVFVIDWSEPWSAKILTGNSSGGNFPNYSDLVLRSQIKSLPTGLLIDSGYGLTDKDSLAVTLGLTTVNTTGSARGIWKKLRVDYK